MAGSPPLFGDVRPDVLLLFTFERIFNQKLLIFKGLFYFVISLQAGCFMKKENLILIICASLIFIFGVTLITLQILGSHERLGYFIVLSDIIDEEFKSSTNREYAYSVKLNYYNKFFKHSDIFGVHLNTKTFPSYIDHSIFVRGGVVRL